MMYRKSFAKNNKKPKANQKRQIRKLSNSRAVNSSLKINKKQINKSSINLSANAIVMIFLITAIGLIVLYRQSIIIYWQQTYHFNPFHSNTNVDKEVSESDDNLNLPVVATTPQTSEHSLANVPLENNTNITPTAEESAPTMPKQQLEDVRKENIEQEVEKNDKVSADLNDHPENVTPDGHSVLSPSPDQLPSNSEPDIPVTPAPIVLTSNDKVFFAGDSLMQGVAPYVKKMLFKQYKIESIDLSKQSTGLAYPKAFNWPKAIEDNLAADSSIRLLVVFLGANDPWDFPVEGYTQYARFKSELWEAQYRLRIESVLNSATAHNVNVLWLAAPCMRKQKLNDGMVYLNGLYQSELIKVQQHFLTTNKLLGCTYEKFNSFIETDNEKIKVRIDDGIHFTPTGQKILAKAIMGQITFKELEGTSND